MEIDWKREYGDRAIKFRKDKGADSHPIISREKHPMQWRDWYAWYGLRGMKASQQLMREKDEKTVPSISPYDFDAGFNPAYQSQEVPRDSRPTEWHQPTPEEKERVRLLMERLNRRPPQQDAAE